MPTRKYELWLVDASSQWSVLDKYPLEEYEHGTALKVMFLTDVVEDSDEVPERSLFIAVGTSAIDNDGEDLASKGRILLFQVKKSKKRARSKDSKDPPLELVLKSEKEMALGPVTALSSLKSEDIYRCVVGAGAEITVEQWGSGKLTQMGFYHAHMQVQEIVLFKTFFLLSDAYDSLHFLVWRESDKSLTLLAKDYEPTQVFAAGLISRGGAMSFVCHDDRQNLSFLQYAPSDVASRGGNKLVCRADYHMGSQTTSLKSHWGQSSLLFNSCTMTSTLAALKQQDTLFGRLEDDNRFAVNFGTTDGSFGSIVPLSEPTYWRLTALQSVMSNALESNCALSHRAWRLYRRSTRRAGCRSNERKKGVIDGDLVMKYVDLPLPEQEDLASSIGSTVGLVMDNLLELGCAASVI
jgi:cleavage and polyadenylation specificity factor subunit 1